MSTHKISIIIPVYNEQENILALIEKLSNALKKIKGSHEAVFIDDGSTDSTFETLVNAKKNFPFIKIIKLSRNSGKSIAYRAGFLNAKGLIVVTMDGDLQDEPEEIPMIIEPIERGYDLSIGWKVAGKNSIGKSFSSRVFSFIASFLTKTKFHDVDCPFRAIKSDVAKIIGKEMYGDLYRFIPIIAKEKGYKIAEVKISNKRRYAGHSKYNFQKIIKGIFDLLTLFFITRFKEKPLHFFGIFGALMFTSGFFIDLGLVLHGYLFNNAIIGHSALLLFGVMLMIMGIQIISIGLLGELIISGNNKEAKDLPIETIIE